MKRITLITLILFETHFVICQELPETLSIAFSQTTTTIGTSTTSGDVKGECLVFKKQGGRIIGYKCNSTSEKMIIYQISGIEKEKKSDEVYTITYFGYQYFSGDPVYSFLTYGYDFNKRKWVVLIENVYDSEAVGTFRCLSKYFNL
jgi:hypothetical protein